MPEAAKLTAVETLKAVKDKHSNVNQITVPESMDVTSTGGLQRNIKALWSAIAALANHVDGIAMDEYGNPIPVKDPATGV